MYIDINTLGAIAIFLGGGALLWIVSMALLMDSKSDEVEQLHLTVKEPSYPYQNPYSVSGTINVVYDEDEELDDMDRYNNAP